MGLPFLVIHIIRHLDFLVPCQHMYIPKQRSFNSVRLHYLGDVRDVGNVGVVDISLIVSTGPPRLSILSIWSICLSWLSPLSRSSRCLFKKKSRCSQRAGSADGPMFRAVLYGTNFALLREDSSQRRRFEVQGLSHFYDPFF